MTGIVEVEPQFVLAADDSKNIFGRPSTAPLNQLIEGSDNKKPVSGQRKRRTVKASNKVKQDSENGGASYNGAEKASRQNSDEDDGFRNYDGSPTPQVSSPPGSAAKDFSETQRSFNNAENSTVRKLNNIPLERIDSD